MAPSSTIPLFEADPELLRFVSEEDRAAASAARLPVLALEPGLLDVRATLDGARAFAAIVLDGMLLESMRVGEHAGLRLIGPADVLALSLSGSSMLTIEATVRVTAPTRLALLGRDLLLAARQWPFLIGGLQARNAEQTERLATQMIICQLPRVDDRLLAILWLLAESWGQVTSAGTVLPIELTHSTLGGLVGARRPTVTLALSELSERGALVRQTGGWLLLERPATRAATGGDALGEPQLQLLSPSRWRAEPAPAIDSPVLDPAAVAELRQTIARLAAEHGRMARQVSERLERMIASREEIVATRERIIQDRRRPRRLPS